MKEVDRKLAALFVVAESSAGDAIPYLNRHLPNTQVQLLGGHFMFWEHPQQFNETLETYIKSLK